MGLDFVDLLMRLEDEFDLVIPDQTATQLRTPGQTFTYILSELRSRQPPGACASSRAFYRLRKELIERLGIPRHRIHPRAQLGELLVTLEGRNAWPKMATAAGLRPPKTLFRRAPRRQSTVRQAIAESLPTTCFFRHDSTVDEALVWHTVCRIVSEVSGLPVSAIRPESEYQRDLDFS